MRVVFTYDTETIGQCVPKLATIWKVHRRHNAPLSTFVVGRVVANEGPAAAGRAIRGILGDPALADQPRLFSPATVGHLLDLAAEAQDPALREDALALTNILAPRETRWHTPEIASPRDLNIAELALGEGPLASRAARLVGRQRRGAAVRVLLDMLASRTEPHAGRVMPALMEIRDEAGSLPGDTPLPLRLRVVAHLARRQLLAETTMLVRAYVVAALGGALGLGFHIYVTFRLPRFLDAARILNAVGGGLLYGLLIGLGIFLTRLIARRLRVWPAIPRAVLGVSLGALVVSLAFLGYHALFLAAPPEGWWIPAGSSS